MGTRGDRRSGEKAVNAKVSSLFDSPALQRQILAARLRLLAQRVERLSDEEMRVLALETNKLNLAMFIPESLKRP
jgi:hypothetical protein